MSTKCPLCGNSKTGEGLFCPDCTEKLNDEYEVGVPISEKSDSTSDVESDETLDENAEPPTEESEIEVPPSEIEERAKVVAAPSFNKRDWKRQREDKRSDSEKSYYELSKEEKSTKAVTITIVIAVLIGALIGGLYIYNNNVKSDNVERSKWEIAQRDNTLDGYLAYMNEYPQGHFSDEAYNNILEIKSREKEEFENLKTSDNSSEFLSFLEQHPDSPYQRMVRSRLDSLVWQLSLKENSAEAYSNYINRTNTEEIEGYYIGEAEKRLKMLKQSTPIDGGDLEHIKSAVDGFFVGVSTRSKATLGEHLTSVVTRYNNRTNLQPDEVITQLFQQVSEEGTPLRMEAEMEQLKYNKLSNGTYEVNVPIQKIIEASGDSINQIKGYIIHLKLSPDFKVYSYYETKPYAEAP